VDYDAIESMDVDLINEHLCALMAGKTINTPNYDMKTGYRVRAVVTPWHVTSPVPVGTPSIPSSGHNCSGIAHALRIIHVAFWSAVAGDMLAEKRSACTRRAVETHKIL
jgi:hypothetical protein